MGARVGVLGPVVVTGEEGAIELGPRRRRELLAALVVDAGRLVTFPVLMSRLWGEDGGASAATLHGLVSRLRSSLRAATDATVIHTEQAGYRLDPDACEIDALVLAAGVAASRTLLAEGRLDRARHAADRAIGLRRGQPYVDVRGEFALAEAARLEEQWLVCHELLAEAELGLGAHGRLLEVLPGLVAEHPLREPLRGALMLALYRAGRQAEALVAYERGRTVLAGELGVDPGPDLQRLWGRMLQQDPDLQVPRSAAVPAVRLTATSPPSALVVGRDAELDALRRVLARAGSGSSTAALVRGEPGIGKSHVVQAAAALARASGPWLVLTGATWEDGGAAALWPWEQVLTEAVDACGADVVRQVLPPDQVALVADLVPALGPGTAGVLPAALARDRLHRAVARLLTSLGRPVLVVLEDLHWADEETLALLLHLIGTLRTGPLAVFATTRPERDHTAAVAAVARSGGEVVELGGLDVDAVGDLVTHHLGERVAPGVADGLRERTDGNPFFVVELTRLLGQERARSGAADVPVPVSVQAVIESRLRVFGPDERDVLSVAALVGREFDVRLVADALDRPVAGVASAVDRAAALGMLVAGAGGGVGAGDQPGDQRFAHALVQEVLEASTGPVRRATWHAQIAAALTARHGAASPSQVLRIAHHHLSAGVVGDPEAAVRYAALAAQVAHRRNALGEAERLLRQGLALTPSLSPMAGEPLELELRLALAAILAQSVSFSAPEVVAQWRQVVGLAGRCGTPDQLLIGLWGVFGAALVGGDIAGAEVAATAMARADVGAAPWLGVAQHQATAQVHFFRGRLARARDDALAGIQRAVGLPPAPYEMFPIDPVAVLHGWLTASLTMLGDEAAAALAGRECDAAARRADHVYTSAYLDILLAWCAVWRGDGDDAFERADRARRSAEEAGFDQFRTFALPPLAWATSRRGDLVGAGRMARTAFAAYADQEPHLFATFVCAVLADWQLVSEDPDAALATVAHGLRRAEEGGEHVARPWLMRLRAEALELFARKREASHAEETGSP